MKSLFKKITTWRERIGQAPDFPLHVPTDVERAMVAEIADLRAAAHVCDVAPPGWNCTRLAGHSGPCAAEPAESQWEELFRTVALSLNCLPSSFIDGNDHVLKQAKLFTSFFLAAEVAMQSSAVDVLAERRRQVEAEGYDQKHDDAHPNEEISAYAALYAMPPAARDWPATETGYGDTLGAALCPVDWTPKFGNRRRELVKAAALLLAEIERIDRAAQSADNRKTNEVES
jgi:hypothetical protein